MTACGAQKQVCVKSHIVYIQIGYHDYLTILKKKDLKTKQNNLLVVLKHFHCLSL